MRIERPAVSNRRATLVDKLDSQCRGLNEAERTNTGAAPSTARQAALKNKSKLLWGPLSETGIARPGCTPKSGTGFAFKSPRAFAPNFFNFSIVASKWSFACPTLTGRQSVRVASLVAFSADGRLIAVGENNEPGAQPVLAGLPP
jgi:hypothetical protein